MSVFSCRALFLFLFFGKRLASTKPPALHMLIGCERRERRRASGYSSAGHEQSSRQREGEHNTQQYVPLLLLLVPYVHRKEYTNVRQNGEPVKEKTNIWRGRRKERRGEREKKSRWWREKVQNTQSTYLSTGDEEQEDRRISWEPFPLPLLLPSSEPSQSLVTFLHAAGSLLTRRVHATCSQLV